MSEKYDPDLKYYTDKIPLDPASLARMVAIFKRNIWQHSPAKEGNWSYNTSVSPSLKNSVVKHPRFTGIDPQELRDQLFETPSKSNREEPSKQFDLSPSKDKTPKARRKLVFEDDANISTIHSNEEEPDSFLQLPLLMTPKKGNSLINMKRVFGETEEEDPSSPLKQSPTKSPLKNTPSPKKKKGKYGQWNILFKKYHRPTPPDIISLCNQFELPSSVAYNILSEFSSHASFCVYPAQIVCGLILLCVFSVHNEKRLQDPSLDDKIIKKMCHLMRSSNEDDVMHAIKITKELIDGEKWYRDLRVRYGYYDGTDFLNSFAIRVGNMLQEEHRNISDEHYLSWKKKIMIDLELRCNTAR